MSTEYLHVAYLPPSGYVHQFMNALRESPSPQAKTAIDGWTVAGVGQLAVALSTKLVMLGIALRRLDRALLRLHEEVVASPDVLLAIDSQKTLALANREVVYETLVDLDSFIFEFRSGYEILGKFVKSMYDLLGIKPPSENELLELLEVRNVPTAWVDILRQRRILHFHQRPPWIAYEVLSRSPLQLSEIVTEGPSMNTADISAGLPLKGLVEIHAGMFQALQVLQGRLLEEIRGLSIQP